MFSSATDHSDNSFWFSNFVVLHVKAHIQSFDRMVSKITLKSQCVLKCAVASSV